MANISKTKRSSTFKFCSFSCPALETKFWKLEVRRSKVKVVRRSNVLWIWRNQKIDGNKVLATVAVFWEHSLSSILHHILDKGSTKDNKYQSYYVRPLVQLTCSTKSFLVYWKVKVTRTNSNKFNFSYTDHTLSLIHKHLSKLREQKWCHTKVHIISYYTGGKYCYKYKGQGHRCIQTLFLLKMLGFFYKNFCPVIAKCSSARNNEYYIINKPIYADDARTNRILISDLSRSHRYLLWGMVFHESEKIKRP